MAQVSTIERAVQLARAGGCRSIDAVRKTLKAERHSGVDQHLAGSAIQRQLRAEIASAKSG